MAILILILIGIILAIVISYTVIIIERIFSSMIERRLEQLTRPRMFRVIGFSNRESESAISSNTILGLTWNILKVVITFFLIILSVYFLVQGFIFLPMIILATIAGIRQFTIYKKMRITRLRQLIKQFIEDNEGNDP